MPRYMFIVNPIAGGGRARVAMDTYERFFREAKADYRVYETSGPGDATAAASRAVAEGYDIVVAAGGDGTVNEVLNGVAGSGAALAAIHGGKGNDFAGAVGMPRDVEGACRDLLAARLWPIDLGRVLNRFFINSVGVGFDAAVALRVNRGVKPLGGTTAYIYAVLEKLLTHRFVPMRIDLGEKVIETTPVLVAVGIGRAYGGGMFIVPDAVQDDGLFDVCVMERISRPALLYHFPKVFQGELKNIAACTIYRTPSLKLTLPSSQPLHMEGEILFGKEMTFTLQRQAMPVVVGSGPVAGS